ncbi:hypothetical protein ABZ904_42630 [Streptomyces sp. NPDC046900]|uniref:hypothetical protein n=1 Tax=Streptomyces sp. NPDC046900 TaxID=3155473 RepID=UPI003409771A
MSNKPQGGSGSSAHKDRTGQPPAKGKGRGTRLQRAQTAPQERQSRAGRAPAAPPRRKARPPVVVHIGEGHPHCEAGTFDAATLLASVLASVEPRITEGLHSLQGAAAEAGDGAETVAQAIRSVGRQLADAVRAGVIEGMRSRDRHLAQLAVIDRAAAQASALAELQERIDRELALVGVRRISELSDLAAFNLADASGTPDGSPLSGDAYELVSPAYVDAETGRMIERGWIRSLPAGPAPAPAGKLHGSVSRTHKDRQRPVTAAGADGPASADQPKTQGPQEDPAPHSSRQGPGGAAEQPAARPAAAAEQTAHHQEPRQGEHRAAPQQTAREEPQPEGHSRPPEPRSGTRPALPHLRPAADPQTEPAAEQQHAEADGPGRAAAPDPAADRSGRDAAEEPGHPLPQTAPADGAGEPRRTAARAPGAVGGVAMPRRYRPQQVGTAPEQDNQPPRSTS